MCGSDPDLVIEARCEVAGDADGTVLVPSRLVVDIVRSFEPGAVTVVAGDEEVRFPSGRAEFLVRVAIGAEITRLGVPEQEGIEIPGSVFADGLRQVVRAALVDDSRAPQLTGVLMVATEGGLEAHRDGLVSLGFPRLRRHDASWSQIGQVLVPAKALGEVQRLVAAAKADAERVITFRYSDLDAVFELDDVRITTRLSARAIPRGGAADTGVLRLPSAGTS